jgi:hypothetical protein
VVGANPGTERSLRSSAWLLLLAIPAAGCMAWWLVGPLTPSGWPFAVFCASVILAPPVVLRFASGFVSATTWWAYGIGAGSALSIVVLHIGGDLQIWLRAVPDSPGYYLSLAMFLAAVGTLMAAGPFLFFVIAIGLKVVIAVAAWAALSPAPGGPSWSSLKPAAVFLGLLLLAAPPVVSGSVPLAPHSDETMIEQFRQHEADFARLADPALTPLSEEGHSLASDLGCIRLWSDAGGIHCTYWSGGLMGSVAAKGYAFLPKPPYATAESLDHVAAIPDEDWASPAPIAYRPLSSGWYLYVTADS